MTPREKAIDLIKSHTNYYGMDDDETNDYKAYYSSQITVNEIIKVLQDNNLNYDYWDAVYVELITISL